MRYQLWLALCVLLTALMPARGEPAGKVTVAAYNVENFFDVFDDPYTEDEEMQPKSRDAIERLAQTIRDINPDVLGLVEIESTGAVEAMVAEFLPDAGYRHIAVMPTNSGRGIHLGVVSRLPVLSMTSHRFRELTLPDVPGRTWTFARDLLEVVVEPAPGRKMHLFIVHLKSRHDGPDDPMSANWRMAEHTMVRRIVAERLAADPAAWVAVMGDFNDTPDTPGVRAYLEGQGDQSPLLYDVHAAPDPERPLTYLRGQYRSVIDYILVSPSLYERLDAVGIPTNEAELLKASDHAPVWARFRVE